MKSNSCPLPDIRFSNNRVAPSGTSPPSADDVPPNSNGTNCSNSSSNSSSKISSSRATNDSAYDCEHGRTSVEAAGTVRNSAILKKWRIGTTNVVAASKLENAKKVSVIDMYATEVQPKTLEGGWLTLGVWMATVIYLVILVVQWVRSPPTVESAPDWTIGRGPFPADLKCHATSGCLFSNRLTDANTMGVASRIATEHVDSCIRIPYNEVLEVDNVFSVHPYEGISVLYDPTTTDETMIEGFGVTVGSQIRCQHGPHGKWRKGCVVILESQAGPGLSTIQYVETDNRTETGTAKFRREYFLTVGNSNGTIQQGSTPCKPDPSWQEYTQARLQMSSFYHLVVVDKDEFWLFLWGTAGGAFTTFFQAAGAILIAYKIGQGLHEKYQQRKQRLGEST